MFVVNREGEKVLEKCEELNLVRVHGQATGQRTYMVDRGSVIDMMDEWREITQ